MKESRTKKSVKNIRIALLFYFVNLVFNFISRKVFIDHLGSEILGLNSTILNLLSFLNLAELGIGNAIAYTLYKPLYDKNIRVVNDIVSVQGWLYRKIAYIILFGSILLICLFPLIFKKVELPLWYAYSTFIVLLVGSILSYFVNYRQIVLTADQKEYKITICIQGIKFFKVLFQVLAIAYLHNGYIHWLILELLMSFITAIVLNKIIKNEYPWLNPVVAKGKTIQKLYPQIISKTKQLFFHKVSSYVLSQTSPLIIYSYTSLTLVAIYGNYMLLIMGCSVFMNSLFNSIAAGVGNLVAERDLKKIELVFWELYSARVWIASIICFGIYKLTDPFIFLWIGEEYLLPKLPFILIIIYAFITLTRLVDIFLGAYGLYQDIAAPIIEAVLNLGFSVLLGYFYGLSGILSGVLISLVIVVSIWKPYFLFKSGFKTSVNRYFMNMIKYIFIIAFSSILSIVTINCINDFNIDGWREFLYKSFLYIIVYTVISFVFFYVFAIGFRGFYLRVKRLVI